MKATYQEVTKFVFASGKRILRKAGKIADIGVTKKYLTDEDTRIENGLETLIHEYHPDHQLFAEETHDTLPDCTHVWVADPISGTKTFIEGLPHFGIAVAHLKNGLPQFSVVYDPSTDELYTAFLGGGAFLNGKLMKAERRVEKDRCEIVLNWSCEDNDDERAQKLVSHLAREFRVFRNKNSFAVNYCHMASGRYDGFVALTKDAFPEIVASLIVREAGCVFKNEDGDDVIASQQRLFFGGNYLLAAQLKSLLCTDDQKEKTMGGSEKCETADTKNITPLGQVTAISFETATPSDEPEEGNMKDGILSDSELLDIHDFCVGVSLYVGRFLEANLGKARAERKGGPIPEGVDEDTYDVVTNIDLSSQKQVATLLLEQYPDFAFHGEEDPKKVFKDEPNSPVLNKVLENDHIYQFVVDPLDGTGRYRDRDARFGFLLGLLENGRFVVCTAYNPMQQSLTSAVKGQGCWRNNRRFRFQSTVDDHVIINSKADRKSGLKCNLASAGLFIMRPKHTGTMYDMMFLQYAPFLVSMKTNTHDQPLTLAVQEAGGIALVHDGNNFIDASDYNWRRSESKKDANIPAVVAANNRANADIIRELVSRYVLD